MIAAMLFVLVPLIPMLAAPLLFLREGERLLPAAPWLPLTALALLPFRGEAVEIPWLLLGTRLGLDATSFPLLLLATTTWTLAGWHARRSLSPAGQPRFFFYWLLTWCGSVSVLLCLDAASFYAAYMLVTFAAYGLVVHLGRPGDYQAGRVYIVMSVLGEGLLLAALLMLVAEGGNVALVSGPIVVAEAEEASWIAAMMLVGFGVKVGLAGLHMWLPLAHPRAPAPASAVLSGVILKTGLIGWLRFLPLGQPGFETSGYVLLALGLTAALGGVAIGLVQRDLKTLLAYSSVSQMGLISMTVALALLDPARSDVYVALAVLFALHHGLHKAALFLSVDLAAAPCLMRTLLWLPAAALAGLPFTSGALIKASLAETLPAAASGLSTWLTVATAATVVLMLRFLSLALRQKVRPGGAPAAPWLCLLAAGVMLPWLHAWRELPSLARTPFAPDHLGEALLATTAGLLIGAAVEALIRRRRLPEIPAGDLLHLLPRLPPAMPAVPAVRWRRVSGGTALAWAEHRLGRLGIAVVAAALALGALLLG